MTPHNLAEIVATNYQGDSEVLAAFDPTNILVFIEIIMELLDAFGNCDIGNSEFISVAQNPNRWHKLLVRLRVRRILGREYRDMSPGIEKALWKAAVQLSEEDVESLRS